MMEIIFDKWFQIQPLVTWFALRTLVSFPFVSRNSSRPFSFPPLMNSSIASLRPRLRTAVRSRSLCFLFKASSSSSSPSESLAAFFFSNSSALAFSAAGTLSVIVHGITAAFSICVFTLSFA